MTKKKQTIPVPRLHKPSGRARIYLNGQYVYLGPWESEEANQEYRRIVAELLAGSDQAVPQQNDLTVAELVARFLPWAKDYYRKPSGRPTGSFDRYLLAVRPLIALYGNMPVSKFGPLALKAVREDMVCSGLARKTTNTRITLIKTLFKWGVENEFVPVNIHLALLTVRILQEGKTDAPDHPPIPAVSLDRVLKTIEYCHKTVADMIRVQLLAGMRPNEVCQMRPCDIDFGDDIWVYTPHEYKTQHHKGKFRTIPLIPESQAILMPYLIEKESTPESYIFSPKDAMQLIHIERRQQRKTKERPYKNRRKRRPKRTPGECYNHNSYRKAVQAAIERANVPKWSPNQLRHTQATEVEQALGIEAAQVMLGHTSPETTKIYLDPDALLKAQKEAVKEIARKIANHSTK